MVIENIMLLYRNKKIRKHYNILINCMITRHCLKYLRTISHIQFILLLLNKDRLMYTFSILNIKSDNIWVCFHVLSNVKDLHANDEGHG